LIGGFSVFAINGAYHQAARITGPSADTGIGTVGVDGFYLIPLAVQFGGGYVFVRVGRGDHLPEAVPLVVAHVGGVAAGIGNAGTVAGRVVAIFSDDITAIMAADVGRQTVLTVVGVADDENENIRWRSDNLPPPYASSCLQLTGCMRLSKS